MQLNMMPTAAKLVAAIYYAPLAFLVASLVIPYLPEGTDPGKMVWVGVFFGVLMGWRMAGRNAGRGFYAGVGYALTTVFLIVLWSLFTIAGRIAYTNSTKLRYDGVMEALQDMFGMVIGFLKFMVQPDIIAVLLVGSLLGAWLVERTARSWS